MLSFRIVKKADNLPLSIATRKKRDSVLLIAVASTALAPQLFCFLKIDPLNAVTLWFCGTC